MNMLKRMGSSGRMLGPKSPGSGKVVEVEGDSSATVASTKSAPPAQHAEDAGQSAFLWALDDVAMLRPLTEEACVQLIQERYQSAPKDKQYDKIHTRAGSVVVAINPLTYDVKEVIYTAAMRQKYHAAASRDPNVEDARYERPPPHIYEVVAKAFVGIGRDHTPQAIVINGESGSGKTETTKLLLEYLSEMSRGPTKGSGGPSLTDKLMASSPLLEACGNAKTLRNDNSSRFGKLIKLSFTKDAQLLCVSMEHYLLEVSRVTSQHTGEQAYHINYYLTMCASDTLRDTVGLQRDGYKYVIAPDDHLAAKFPKEWEDCQQSLATMLGCTPESPEVFAVWKVAAAVLHLGQVEFDEIKGEKGDTQTDISEGSKATASRVADLLGIDLETLRGALVTRLIMSQRPPRTKTEAGNARDALARTIYKYLFNVLVTIINQALIGDGAGQTSDLFLGMLDIFGSEVLSVNSFEQLLINYANDKLQLYFTDVTFMNIKREYEAEGIDQHMKEIKDISPTLEMIEGVPVEVRGRMERSECLLSILDADTLTSDKTHKRLSVAPGAMAKPESRDTKVFKVLTERIGKKEGFIPYAGIMNPRSREIRDKFPKSVESNGHTYDTNFVVVHFGNEVPYCIEGFCERNADQLDTNLKELLQKCADKNRDNPFMHSIFDQEAAKERSIAFKFREEMAKLVDRSLRLCNGHFIRCIKPNNERKPFLLDPNTCTPQLQSCGVKEAAVVAQAGFDKSFKPQDLVSIVVKGMIPNATWDRLDEEKRGKLALYYLHRVFHVNKGSGDYEDYAIGKTKIFFRPGVWEQCMARQVDFENIAEAVVSARKKRVMREKMMKFKADVKEQVKRNATRRISMVDNEEQVRAEQAMADEHQNQMTAAIGKAMAEAEMAKEEELEREKQKLAEKHEAELERVRAAAQAELAEQLEAAQLTAKTNEVKMQLEAAEQNRQNEELTEFKNEAEYLREELNKYKTEVAVLRGLLQDVKDKTMAYIKQKGNGASSDGPKAPKPNAPPVPAKPSVPDSMPASSPPPIEEKAPPPPIPEKAPPPPIPQKAPPPPIPQKAPPPPIPEKAPPAPPVPPPTPPPIPEKAPPPPIPEKAPPPPPPISEKAPPPPPIPPPAAYGDDDDDDPPPPPPIPPPLTSGKSSLDIDIGE